MEDQQNSAEYYRRREEYERLLATNAASPEIRRIHLEMADRYRALSGSGREPAIRT
jgi:hypothetical protein